MKRGDKEFYDIMAAFEKSAGRLCGVGRLDKEAKELWGKRHYYQDGHTNNLFVAYLEGYALGHAVGYVESQMKEA